MVTYKLVTFCYLRDLFLVLLFLSSTGITLIPIPKSSFIISSRNLM